MAWSTLGVIAEEVAYALSVLGITGIAWRLATWIVSKVSGKEG